MYKISEKERVQEYYTSAETILETQTTQFGFIFFIYIRILIYIICYPCVGISGLGTGYSQVENQHFICFYFKIRPPEIVFYLYIPVCVCLSFVGCLLRIGQIKIKIHRIFPLILMCRWIVIRCSITGHVLIVADQHYQLLFLI